MGIKLVVLTTGVVLAAAAILLPRFTQEKIETLASPLEGEWLSSCDARSFKNQEFFTGTQLTITRRGVSLSNPDFSDAQCHNQVSINYEGDKMEELEPAAPLPLTDTSNPRRWQAQDPGSKTPVTLELQADDTLHMTVGAGPVETYKRLR